MGWRGNVGSTLLERGVFPSPKASPLCLSPERLFFPMELWRIRGFGSVSVGNLINSSYVGSWLHRRALCVFGPLSR